MRRTTILNCVRMFCEISAEKYRYVCDPMRPFPPFRLVDSKESALGVATYIYFNPIIGLLRIQNPVLEYCTEYVLGVHSACRKSTVAHEGTVRPYSTLSFR